MKLASAPSKVSSGRVLWFWWHLHPSSFLKKTNAFQFDVALLKTLITKKEVTFFFNLLFTHLGKSLCIAQKQATALLITGALLFPAGCCSSRTTLSFRAEQPSEGSLSLRVLFFFYLVNMYNKAISSCHVVPGTFSVLVQCLTSAVIFFCFVLFFLLPVVYSLCRNKHVHYKLTVRVVALICGHGNRVKAF